MDLDFASMDAPLIFITEENSIFKLAKCYQDGERFNWDLVEVPSLVGRRFKLKKGNEQYEVDEGGDLRVYGFENKMMEATPLVK